MKQAQILVVKLNTIGRRGNEFVGPFTVSTETDFKAIVQRHFDTYLKGIAGYVLILFQKKLFQCERDNINPAKPYVRFVIAYHPYQDKFTSQKAS